MKGTIMTTEKLNVEGMTCGHCKARVEKAVTDIDGVISAEADLQAQSVTVETDGSVDTERIRKAIEGIGYTVK